MTSLATSDYELFVDEGTDYAEIVKRAESWKATRVLVGATSHSRLAAAFLGSVAERVIRAAPCPVHCVRGVPGTGPVVAATDLSDLSLSALALAVDEAKTRGVKLVVAYSMDFGDATFLNNALSPLLVTSVIPKDAADTARRLARETIDAKVEALGAKDAEVVILDGAAATAIVHLAAERGASLVVVGTPGRTGLQANRAGKRRRAGRPAGLGRRPRRAQV